MVLEAASRAIDHLPRGHPRSCSPPSPACAPRGVFGPDAAETRVVDRRRVVPAPASRCGDGWIRLGPGRTAGAFLSSPAVSDWTIGKKRIHGPLPANDMESRLIKVEYAIRDIICDELEKLKQQEADMRLSATQFEESSRQYFCSIMKAANWLGLAGWLTTVILNKQLITTTWNMWEQKKSKGDKGLWVTVGALRQDVTAEAVGCCSLP
uniref:Uncharacterized protein n=1 Tax=Oryza punctata TaxID=4537 RepID=A0A0E0JHF7_ORYPU